MKTKLAAILTAIAILSSVALADPETESTPAPATLEEAVVASGWTVQELITALNLMEAKYNRDVATKEGRKSWHGKPVSETVDTNTLTKVSVYEDGTVFSDPAKIMTAAMAAKAQIERLQPQTNGIPARLAAARLRQRQHAETVSNVTVRITAGGVQ